jgi:hypothetical protein
MAEKVKVCFDPEMRSPKRGLCRVRDAVEALTW